MRLPARRSLGCTLIALALLFAGVAPALAEDIVYAFGRGGLEIYRGTITKGFPDGSIRFVTTEGEEILFLENEIANVIRDAKPEALSLDPADTGVSLIGERRRSRRFPVAFHGWVGWGGQSLSDVNRTFQEDEELFQSSGIAMQFDRFGSAPEFGIGLAFPFSNGLGVGVEVGYQASSVQNLYLDELLSIAANVSLRVIDVTATGDYELPMVKGLTVGGTAGIGLGHAEQDVAYLDFVNLANSETSHSSWGGSGFSGGLYAGYQRPLGNRSSLYLRTGYRSRDLGLFNGRTDSPDLTGPSKPVDNAGNDITFDFSGAYARVGFAFVVGH